MERAFGTLQGGIPQELRVRGYATAAAAKVYLQDVFMPDFNARFGVKPSDDGSADIAYVGAALEDTLCLQEDRQVGNDNTVVFHKLRLQIPPSPLRAHFVRSTVKVRQYHDGSHAIFLGPRCIGRYDEHGALRTAALEVEA